MLMLGCLTHWENCLMFCCTSEPPLMNEPNNREAVGRGGISNVSITYYTFLCPRFNMEVMVKHILLFQGLR